MANMIISYDLRNQRDYSSLIAAIHQLGTAIRILESVWYVKTVYTAPDCIAFLTPHLDYDDAVVAFDCSRNNGDIYQCLNEPQLRALWERA